MKTQTRLQSVADPLDIPDPVEYPPATLLLPRYLLQAWAIFKSVKLSTLYALPEVAIYPQEWLDFKEWLSKDMVDYNQHHETLRTTRRAL